MIDGFIFDMDGVLFDTERVFNQCFSEAGAEYGVPDIDYFLNACLGISAEESRNVCMARLPKDFPYDEMQLRVRELMNEKLSEEGMPVKSGVYLMLEYLKANRYPVGLASSSSRNSVMHHMEEANMTDYFSVIVCKDDVEKGKPAPDIYLKALDLMNLRGKNVYAFEDSPNGLRAASSAGLKAIMIPDQIPYSEDVKPYVYEHFNSMTSALEALKKGEI